VPGSLSIPLRGSFATWLGWLVPDDVPLVIVRNLDQDPDEIVWPAINIGYERIAGELAGGVDAWQYAGGEVRATALRSPAEADGAVLDIRQDDEFRSGHLPDARHIELGELPRLAEAVADDHTLVMCGHGERAATGASLLERTGHRRLSIMVGGGAHEWSQATGRSLDTGA
jgi:hydroxyacylglutathione hydrolase